MLHLATCQMWHVLGCKILPKPVRTKSHKCTHNSATQCKGCKPQCNTKIRKRNRKTTKERLYWATKGSDPAPCIAHHKSGDQRVESCGARIGLLPWWPELLRNSIQCHVLCQRRHSHFKSDKVRALPTHSTLTNPRTTLYVVHHSYHGYTTN